MASENPTDRSHAQPDQQPPRTWVELGWRILWPLDRPWKIIIAVAIGVALAMIGLWATLSESSRDQVFSYIFSQNAPLPKSSPPQLDDVGRPSRDGAKGGGETKPGKVAIKFKNTGNMQGNLTIKYNNGVAFSWNEIPPGSEVTINLSPGVYIYDLDTGVTPALPDPCYTFKRNASGKFTVKEGTQKSIDLPAIGVVKIPDCKPTLRPTLRK